MPVFDLWSKRKKQQERAGQPDVLQYDALPVPFLVQVVHIWMEAIGVPDYTYGSRANKLWDSIHHAVAKEHGLFYLGDRSGDPFVRCQQYLLNRQTSMDAALDLIELSLRVIDRVVRSRSEDGYDDSEARKADDAIKEFNTRCREHSLGYEYADGQIVCINSQYLHAEVVRPALALLYEQGFRGASEEFMKAHEHYRKGRYKEAIAEALKAFESTMKSILAVRQWPYPPTAPASGLIQALLDRGLIPSYLQSQLGALRTLLESGIPTVRNKTSGHGQGLDPVPVPPHLAAYALHLAATNIVFIVEAHKALPAEQE